MFVKHPDDAFIALRIVRASHSAQTKHNRRFLRVIFILLKPFRAFWKRQPNRPRHGASIHGNTNQALTVLQSPFHELPRPVHGIDEHAHVFHRNRVFALSKTTIFARFSHRLLHALAKPHVFP
jgi:hypothetical protein